MSNVIPDDDEAAYDWAQDITDEEVDLNLRRTDGTVDYHRRLNRLLADRFALRIGERNAARGERDSARNERDTFRDERDGADSVIAQIRALAAQDIRQVAFARAVREVLDDNPAPIRGASVRRRG